jgi:hypothetical protein
LVKVLGRNEVIAILDVPELVVGSSVSLELDSVAFIIIGEYKTVGKLELIILSVVVSLFGISWIKLISSLHDGLVGVAEVKEVIVE